MTTDLLAQARALVGLEQYPEAGEFPVERGYVWTSCASVENGNPLYWDDEVAQALTGAPIAPPTMVSVWFRPHHWAPARDTEALPLQVHRSISDEKTTKLGTGRFWVIDVVYQNQDGELVALESYTGFGYRRGTGGGGA
jgi:hypothetical protein